DWGAWVSWTMSTVNHAPTASASNSGVPVNTAVGMSALFSASDADGDAIQTYRFWDPAGRGYITVGGGPQLTNTPIGVAGGNLGTVNYVGGSTAGSELQWVQVYDGYEWGAWVSWTMATQRVGNAVPVVNAPNVTLLQNQWVRASSLFSVNDGDGDPITQYQFQ